MLPFMNKAPIGFDDTYVHYLILKMKEEKIHLPANENTSK